MNQDFLIRTYRESDREGVRALWLEQLPPNKPHNQVDWSIDNKINFQPELFFVAECDGAIVGTCMAGYDGHRGWLYSVATLRSYTRRGIARALAEHAVIALKELGCLKVNLQVDSNNPNGIKFWESVGWQVEPRVSMGRKLYDS